ncbi:dynamin-binding -like isoform X1, partial [Brachionus plicatilis]
MNNNLRIAQIVNQPSLDSDKNFHQGDVLYILYELEDKIFANNLMIDSPIFDFVQKDCLQFLHIPYYLIQSSSLLHSLYVASSDFTECEPGDLRFIKSQLIIAEKSIDENWLFGKYLNDATIKGIFPITHVRKVNLADWDVTKYVNFDVPTRQA